MHRGPGAGSVSHRARGPAPPSSATTACCSARCGSACPTSGPSPLPAALSTGGLWLVRILPEIRASTAGASSRSPRGRCRRGAPRSPRTTGTSERWFTARAKRWQLSWRHSDSHAGPGGEHDVGVVAALAVPGDQLAGRGPLVEGFGGLAAGPGHVHVERVAADFAGHRTGFLSSSGRGRWCGSSRRVVRVGLLDDRGHGRPRQASTSIPTSSPGATTCGANIR
jgi:hypothetical protein